MKIGGIEVKRNGAWAWRVWFAGEMLVGWEGFEAVPPSVSRGIAPAKRKS
jgi:hypothetical protein